MKELDFYQLKEILVHFRNICQHSHEDTIRSTIGHYKKLIINNFNNHLNKPEAQSTSQDKLKQLVISL